jgi:hypothetical protein
MIGKRKRDKTEQYKKIKEDVNEIEQYLKEYVKDIWSDPELITKYNSILKLKMSDRKLLLTYICFEKSIPKTASFFRIERKVLVEEITRIINRLNFSIDVLY